MCFDRVRSCLSDPIYGAGGPRGLRSRQTEIAIRRPRLLRTAPAMGQTLESCLRVNLPQRGDERASGHGGVVE